MKLLRNLAIALSVFALSILAVAAQDTTEQGIVFSDVSSDSAYADDIYKLAEAGVLNGYEDGSFRPDGGVTRAEMTKMIGLVFGYTDIEGAEGFPDVTSDDWFYPYVLAAQKAGFVNGFEDGTFRGGQPITREEVCVIIDRCVELIDIPIDLRVSDEISDWAEEAVMRVLKNSLVPLEANNTFRAKETIKRYELVNAIANFVVEPEPVATAMVSFYVGGEKYVETDEIICGEYATVPSNPAAPEGYHFDGWKIKGKDGVVDVKSYMIDEDVDFEAVFLINKYTVSFYDDKTVFNTQEVEHGKNAVLPEGSEPARDGYTFEGWSLTETGSTVDVASTVINAETSFYAIFKVKESGGSTGGPSGPSGPTTPTTKTYTVTFYVNGEQQSTENVKKGSTAQAPADPQLEGMTFEGWALNEDGNVIDVSTVSIESNTDFYAVFSMPVENPNDPVLTDMLTRGLEQITAIRMTDDKQKTVRTLIVGCIRAVLKDGEEGILTTPEYVTTTYAATIDEVQTIIYDEMTTREASNLSNLITNNVDQDVQTFLKDYFMIEQ